MPLIFRILSYTFLLFIWISPQALNAQHHEHDHDHSLHPHEHPKNEIGLGNYLSYLAGENEIAYALHIHYLRSFEGSRFGAGIGYEHVFDKHRHRSLTFNGTFRPASPLVLSLAPGILFGTQEEPGIRFALHTEAVYEIEIKQFHLGPALEFATTFDEYHIGIGFHFAFTF
jgi:hypothetical protein